MQRELYGILQAAPEARRWLPHLESKGSSAVLAIMTLFVETSSSLASPSVTELSRLSGYHRSSVHRFLGDLEQRGVLTRVSSRPVYDLNGVAKGGKVPVWALNPAPDVITTDASDGTVGVNATRASGGAHGKIPLSHPGGPTVASRGSHWRVRSDTSEYLKDLNAPAAASSPLEGSSAPSQCPVHHMPLERADDGSNVCAYCDQEGSHGFGT